MTDIGICMEDIDRNEHVHLLDSHVAASRRFLLHLSPPWPAPVTIALGGWEQCRADYRVDRTSYPFTVLELVVGGQGELRMEGECYALRAGSLFCVPKNAACQISTDPQRRLEKYFIAVAGPKCRSYLRSVGLEHLPHMHILRLGELRQIFDLIVREGQNADGSSQAICSRLCEVLFLRIAREKVLPPAEVGRMGSTVARDRFETCRRIIDEDAAQLPNLAAIATRVGLDPSSVCRLFRRFLGVTPHRYLLHRKMMIAADLLLEPGSSVQNVARNVGMEDPFHFSRVFRSVHGVPPRVMRSLRR
ncbi:MAG: AraC family transcriptional regulator [Verrucomicrobiia bacterium]